MSTSLAVNRRQTVKITKDEINHVAALSRLEFGEDEKADGFIKVPVIIDKDDNE